MATSKSAIVTSKLKVAAANEMVLGGMHSPIRAEDEKYFILTFGAPNVFLPHYSMSNTSISIRNVISINYKIAINLTISLTNR